MAMILSATSRNDSALECEQRTKCRHTSTATATAAAAAAASAASQAVTAAVAFMGSVSATARRQN